MDLMFEAYLTHESTSQQELNDIPRTNEPVWILGRKYDAMCQLDEIRQDIRSRLWFSYRKGFVSIGESGHTSDKGWGCMLRCGQMVIAQALQIVHLGRDWRWSPSTRDKLYLRILHMFEDKRAAPYSIHQIALTGASEGKQVGEWFGPNTVAQVLKKLATFEKWSSLVFHIALDNVLVTSEVKKLCYSYNDSNSSSIMKDSSSSCSFYPPRSKYNRWKPLVLIIPLRLGLNEVNPIYLQAFKACFTFDQSLGVIGGRPNHALYFIGCVGNDAIFLDPHTTQPVGFVRTKETDQECKVDSSYHCARASRLHILQMDPSVAVCFLCRSELEFDSLCHLIKSHLTTTSNQPLFEICEHRTPDWCLTPSSPADADIADEVLSPFCFDICRKQIDDSDDDFEFIG